MRSRRSIAVAAAFAVVLAACGGLTTELPDDRGGASSAPSQPPQGSTSAAPSSPSGAAPSTGTAGNAEVLAFTAPDLEGGTFDASEYAGRDVVLWMWAPW